MLMDNNVQEKTGLTMPNQSKTSFTFPFLEPLCLEGLCILLRHAYPAALPR